MKTDKICLFVTNLKVEPILHIKVCLQAQVLLHTVCKSCMKPFVAPERAVKSLKN